MACIFLIIPLENSTAKHLRLSLWHPSRAAAWLDSDTEGKEIPFTWVASIRSTLCCGLTREHSIHPCSPAPVWLSHIRALQNAGWSHDNHLPWSWWVIFVYVFVVVSSACFASAWSHPWGMSQPWALCVICFAKRYLWGTCSMFPELCFSPYLKQFMTLL